MHYIDSNDVAEFLEKVAVVDKGEGMIPRVNKPKQTPKERPFNADLFIESHPESHRPLLKKVFSLSNYGAQDISTDHPFLGNPSK
jgi:hypothetical protein